MTGQRCGQAVLDQTDFVGGFVEVVKRVDGGEDCGRILFQHQLGPKGTVGPLHPVEAGRAVLTGLQWRSFPVKEGAPAFQQQAQGFAAVLAAEREMAALVPAQRQQGRDVQIQRLHEARLAEGRFVHRLVGLPCGYRAILVQANLGDLDLYVRSDPVMKTALRGVGVVAQRPGQLRKPLAQGVRKLAVGLGIVIGGVPHLFEMKDDGGGMFAGKADRAGADAAEPVALVEHQRLAVAIAAGAAAARLDEAVLLACDDDAVFRGVLPPFGQGAVGERQLPAGRQVGKKVTGHGSAARRDGAPGP